MAKRWRMVHGDTHSRNARAAEEQGEMPLTRAVEAVYAALECKEHKVSRRKVRDYLAELRARVASRRRPERRAQGVVLCDRADR